MGCIIFPLIVVVVAGMLYIRGSLLKQNRPTVLPRIAFAALFLLGGLLGVVAFAGILFTRRPLLKPEPAVVELVSLLGPVAFLLGGALLGGPFLLWVTRPRSRERGDNDQRTRGSKAGIVTFAVVTFAVAVFVGLVVLGGLGTGMPVTFGPGEEVYPNGGATREDAARLGRALEELGYFNRFGEKTVLVEKTGKGYVVSLIVQDSTAYDPRISKQMERMRTEISRKAFDGKRVELRLCNEYMRTLKTFE